MNVRVVTLESVGSTNDEVVERVVAGESPPLAVRAIEQHAGRGRHGRVWASPRGGVWLSVADAWRGPEAGVVAMRSALAVLSSVAEEIGSGHAQRLRIKWPNDLLLDGMKIAGVLCERREHPSSGAMVYPSLLVIGVGINADFDAASLPADVRTPATTLRSVLGRRVDAEGLAARLIERLAHVLRSAGEPLAEHELGRLIGSLAYLDEPVRVARLDGSVLEGTLAGLAPDGRAAIRVGSGPGSGVAWLAAGDVERAAGG